ncbi:putative small nuclear ribonucleoprotein Sm [Gregarina niphandrodes]|uniref:Small nuclear ribonucleoprotein Sm D3 n=1 Tax=Gregarina niphandrodes TaxID=110365 RepID=A0A023B8F5_GRENI|nr:putative small nuclear ribonucleoprotein Sm [Gregarina niphandrodes]EZG69109.1 putative small nuclear ribonucleoprotein Sm [Gregarina niphandrodes]|eukprot:XP_011134489.1 putative small nuclear ribonucleoprotein Sm [Gregarina niphandrodes]
MNVGIPLKLYYESLGHTVTVEMKTGDTVRGTLANVEDNMNILLVSTTFTSKSGKATPLELVFVRGSQIRFTIFPDMLRYAPMFKLAKAKGQKGLGIGQQRRQMVMKAHQGGNLFLNSGRGRI